MFGLKGTLFLFQVSRQVYTQDSDATASFGYSESAKSIKLNNTKGTED